MDILINEILDSLKIELEVTEPNDVLKLRIKIKNALEEVIDAMHYPDYYEESKILKDVKRKRSVIRNIARYDYCIDGAEGQNSHSENGIQRTWVDRDKLFAFTPFAKI